jgi:hypothetical protein
VRRFISQISGVLLVFCVVHSASAAGPTTRGAFHITFDQQSPLSPIEAQNKRHHIKIEPDERYKIADESFEMYVPEDCDGSKPYGLLVWVNAGDRGSIPHPWETILDQHKLIGVGANQSGNQRLVGVRFGLALDAVYNVQRLYNIDEGRIYVTGVSGGGKVASMLPIIYPEVFNGAIPIVGVGYFRHIPVTGKPNGLWPGVFERPPLPVFERARQLSRLVIITGENDFNRASIKDIFEQGYRKDNFEHVEYVEVPGMGHGVADAAHMDQALTSLDAPLSQIAPKQFQIAQDLEKTKKFADAMKLYTQVTLHGDDALATKAKQRIEQLAKQSSGGRK